MNSTAADRLVEVVNQAVEDATSVYREELNQVNAQLQFLKMEDQGWLTLFGYQNDEDGLTLDQVKDWSKQLRESVAGSPLPKQANLLRFSYTFSQPYIIPGLKATVEPVRGRRPTMPRLNDFHADDINQRYVFGKEAQELISTSCSTDGCYLALGDDKTRTVRPIPVKEIVGVLVNPDYPGEVWAYQRQWSVPSTDASKPAKTKKFWYYTDRFPNDRQASISGDPVDREKTMIDFVVNQQTGWTFGIPDLMAGQVWNRNYVTMLNHGKEVSEALAKFAMVVKSQSKAGAQSMGLKMKATEGAGNTAILGAGNEMGALTSARSAYDFDGLRPIASMYAASAGVSVVDLLASPAAAGSSYGSAAALAPGMRRGIEARRQQIAGWMERVIKWGTGESIQVAPASIEEVDPYRRMQMLKLAEQTGLFHPDELRGEFAYLASITLKHDERPDGYLQPNNSKSLPRKDIDTDGSASSNTTASSPGQGQSSGDGGAGSTAANDQRTDTVS